MPQPIIFDQSLSTRFVQARQVFLRKLLPDIKEGLSLRTAADVGCGVGYFSRFLREMGFRVVAFDGREANIEEAKRRNPEIEFHVADVEDPALQKLGSFDLVLCFGLLYHLENPLQTLRNLCPLTDKLLLIESACIPGEVPILYLRDEVELEDQGIRCLVSYPSEGCLIKMGYRAGFPFVYRFTSLPVHEDFQVTLGRKRARTMLAASKVPLSFPFLALAEEPVNPPPSWPTARIGVPPILGRLEYFLRRPWPEKLATLRRRFGLG